MNIELSDIEIKEYRKLFPITKNYIYLDHSGVAPVSLRAIESVNAFLKQASEHAMVRYDEFMEKVESVRDKFAGFLNADSSEIAFVKNTSHGLSLLAKGLEWNRGDNLILIDREFPTNIYPWLDLEKNGVEIRRITLVDGKVRLNDIRNKTDNNTKLLTISSVQFTNGYRTDLNTIGRLSKEYGFYFCVDAIQSLGIVPIDVKHNCIDFLSADGHKWLLSPEGTGVVYCSKDICDQVEPVLLGWKSVVNDGDYEKIDYVLKENALKFEEGSFNVMGITALGGSLDLILEIGIEKIFNRIQYLGDIIIELANKRKFILNTPIFKEERGGIVSFRCGFDPYAIKEELMKKGIVVNVRDRAIRVSPHFYNTENEIYSLFSSIDDIIANG